MGNIASGAKPRAKTRELDQDGVESRDPNAISTALFEPRCRNNRDEKDSEVVETLDKGRAREKPFQRILLIMGKDGVAEEVGETWVSLKIMSNMPLKQRPVVLR